MTSDRAGRHSNGGSLFLRGEVAKEVEEDLWGVRDFKVFKVFKVVKVVKVVKDFKDLMRYAIIAMFRLARKLFRKKVAENFSAHAKNHKFA